MTIMTMTTSSSPSEPLQPIIIRVDNAMRVQLRERAAQEERTQAQIIRRALRAYLEKPLST